MHICFTDVFFCSFMSPLRRHIRLLHGKMGFFGGFFGPSSVNAVGPTWCVDEICSVPPSLHTLKIWGVGVYSPWS